MAHGSLNASSYLNDIIKNSTLISEGPPAQYRLTTTRSNLVEDGKVRKWTFGQRDITKPNKTLLIVGETGTGKTTLINVLVNYALGVKFEDNVWFCITEEKEVDQADQTTTQTIQITVYEVFGQNSPFSLTIIDTPGFGDTRGAEYDEEVGVNLHRLLLNDTGVKEVDAVCLVVKASMNRLSERQRYIFDAVLCLFGKDVENNIVVCVTHSDGGPPTNAITAVVKAKIPCRKDNKNKPVCFLFNNRQTENLEPEYQSVYKGSWDLSEKSVTDLLTSLEQHNKISVDQTKDVLEKRIQLKACISNLYERIEFTEKKQEELTQIQDALHENEEKMKNNENFTFIIKRSHKEKVEIDSQQYNKATTCSVCEENCHLPCKIAWSASWCKVMEKGKCTVCTKKCPVNKHVRENKKYIIKTEDKMMTFKKLKEELERNQEPEADFNYDQTQFNMVKRDNETNMADRQVNKSTMDRLEDEITQNEKKKNELMEEACNTILTLCEIALKPDSAFIMESLDFWISRMEEAGQHEWVQKLKELRNVHPEEERTIQTVQRYFTATLASVRADLSQKFAFWKKTSSGTNV